jgi:peptidoglycan/xylan/chitin deacetylase (PgdA/CDA1 family)
MRFVVALALCMAGGIAAAGAQAIPQPVDQAATPTEQAADQVASAAPPPAVAVTPSAEAPAAQSIKQAALHHVAEPAYYPVEDPPAEPIEQTAEPAYYPIEDPPAEPVEVAHSAVCPGHPDAIGTSRVVTISPSEYSLLGTIQYRQTLPLKDHEVVLTFDDGPIPPYTNSILDTLAANCVKATYFLVGEMARQRPYLVRRIYNEGHSIGTHTQHHPFAFQRLSLARVEREVDGGIASVDGALGNPMAVSPFFRIPGLGRTKAIEHFLEKKGLVTWSADVDTDDWWRGSTPAAIVQRAMRRLNAKGRGIILMHDIHPATALALPSLLKALKAGGYRVVQVVAAGERPKSLPQVEATAAEKEVWPRVRQAKAEKSGATTSALRHRATATVSARRHYRRHSAKRAKLNAVNYTTTARKRTNASSY